jgi:hypothetical protein
MGVSRRECRRPAPNNPSQEPSHRQSYSLRSSPAAGDRECRVGERRGRTGETASWVCERCTLENDPCSEECEACAAQPPIQRRQGSGQQPWEVQQPRGVTLVPGAAIPAGVQVHPNPEAACIPPVQSTLSGCRPRDSGTGTRRVRLVRGAGRGVST